MDEDYGRKIYNLLVGVVVVLGAIWALWFINRDGDDEGRADRPRSCRDLLGAVVSAERNDREVDGAIYDSLGDQCPNEFEIWRDWHSMRTFSEGYGADPCRDALQYDIHPGAIRLARQDGTCY